MYRSKKTYLIFLGAMVIIAASVILLSSYVAKYLVEKHDEKYTGRKITLDWAYANPFTGYIHLSNLKIYEQRTLSVVQPGLPVQNRLPAITGDSILLSARGLSVNFAMLKLLLKTYEISECTLDHPRGMLILNKKELNFTDLIERFSRKRRSDSRKALVHFNILNIKVIEGEFHYHEPSIPISYFIKKVNFESSGKRWDADTIAGDFSLLQGIGSGTIKGNVTINVKNSDYRFAAIAQQFDLNIIGQYLSELMNYGSFSAILEADIKAAGNFGDQENISVQGRLSINDFHFGKDRTDDYVSFDKFALTILELSPKKYKYFCDSVTLIRPYLKYERYDSLDNLQRMFGKRGANVYAANASSSKSNLVIALARYIKVLSRNFFQSDYKIKRLAISNANLKFNDFSISEKFSVNLDPLNITADSIDKDHRRVNLSLRSGIKPYGDLSVDLSINPKDTGDFDMQYHFQKVPASLFNPYIITYSSFPLDRGTVELKGTWKVRNGIIKSDNHLILIDPRQTRQLRNKDTKWIPLPLIMAIIRQRGNVIDYKIPINGNMRNPTFHLGDILLDLFKNMLIKPATAPYEMLVRNNETKIERSLTLKWPMRNSSISRDQEKFIERMADFLVKNPDAFIVVYPQRYAIKEKEYILFFEAKKKYFLQVNYNSAQSFSEKDSREVDKLSIRSVLFADYIRRQINDSLVFTLQEKCALLIDSDVINAKLEQLTRERENAFLDYFKKKKVEKQIKFSTPVNVIPYNGFSFYKIEYNDKFPKSLIKAYRQMNELDEEATGRYSKNVGKERTRAFNAASVPMSGN